MACARARKGRAGQGPGRLTHPLSHTADAIHIRIQQRNGRKTITTLQGLPAEYDRKKLLKAFKSALAVRPLLLRPSLTPLPCLLCRRGVCLQRQYCRG